MIRPHLTQSSVTSQFSHRRARGRSSWVVQCSYPRLQTAVYIACVASEYTKCFSSSWPSQMYGFWTSGQREDACCCTGQWLWKLSSLTSRSFSTDPWISSAWNTGEPSCGAAFPPPNDKETCTSIVRPAAPAGSGGRWNDLTCNFETCAVCGIEM